MTASEFASLVRSGVLLADETYRDWTNGWGLAHGGVEGFITTLIGKHIIDGTRHQRGPEGGFVALELMLDKLMFDLAPDDQVEHFRRLLDDARHSDPAIAESLKRQARLDLVFYDARWPENADKLRPRGIVEVKRWFDGNSYPKDMQRIANLLTAFGPNNGGSLLYGCFVFFIFQRDKAHKSLQEDIERYKGMRSQFEKYGCGCDIEATSLLTTDSNLAKAAAVSVTFEAAGIESIPENGGLAGVRPLGKDQP